ncbi:DUF4395 domain-containing protein [Jonesia denitrificans]|uniref:DUF4395 domain-containing protein n=1 Tax=Jonesia denitrificans (strain ATCC 14870 / DSM 20603 / BCRC 15368 / CIP 55.134 / JCM 11481 / NBRC 15587 / NCTC 10816 / Prevot 55134) TaxID=471856 RepID=C7R2T3_JONDD|nr:DUF4395 domain-containing protein [Jonesia denitrificans]ACV10074.1 hypothetical protein Jden_2442 [Jonesia denitrificans DSM 20603]ASE08697.1 DUF4395 domain-containing protein [Jonesia denitrificans]QXB43303.1 DUF4395 domain-containing protein [Jonesia denitrificans]SQH22915.1 Uncharacterised protein [Jonesia denitrificans]
MRSFFSFPNPVNERAARTVAAGVVALTCVALLFRVEALVWVIAAGFVGRVLAGPRLSVLGFVAQRVIAPRLGEPIAVPGPPKRFAQGIGATVSVGAVVLLAVGWDTAAWVLLTVLVVAASLEAFAGLCIGCWLFAHLQRLGMIPDDVCEACSDIHSPQARAAAREYAQRQQS